VSEDECRLVSEYLSRRDEKSFLEIYRRHTPALLGLAARLAAGDGSEAEEIVQEAWARAAGALPSFLFRSAMRTWLSGFVVNVWRERRRSGGRAEGDEDTDSVAAAAPPPDSVQRLDLARAIAALPDGFRAVLVLHDVEGFTHEEIATQLGIESGTSKSQLARARRALRSRLAGSVARGERR